MAKKLDVKKPAAKKAVEKKPAVKKAVEKKPAVKKTSKKKDDNDFSEVDNKAVLHNGIYIPKFVKDNLDSIKNKNK